MGPISPSPLPLVCIYEGVYDIFEHTPHQCY